MREEPRSAREEPHSKREYVLPSEEISENVIKEYIIHYCGSAAEVTAAVSKVCHEMTPFIEGEVNVSQGSEESPNSRKSSTERE